MCARCEAFSFCFFVHSWWNLSKFDKKKSFNFGFHEKSFWVLDGPYRFDSEQPRNPNCSYCPIFVIVVVVDDDGIEFDEWKI